MGRMFVREYLEELKQRGARSSPISRGYQLIGLMLADILKDRAHKHLYLKLAREYEGSDLLGLAKDVVGRKNVANYGAYFMRRFQQTKGTIRRTAWVRRRQIKLPLRKKRTTRNG
jgi:hypothetical protein